MSGEYDTDVLVVGSGPTGATCALALATYGVRVRVATKWNWLANGPRAHITNQRALEVLRDLGVEAEATSVATPWNLMGDTMFTTSLAGEEVARLRTWGTGENRLGDYLQGSPCPLLDIPQPYMEPVLIKNAAARGAEIMFSTEYLSHVQDDNGVTSTLRDRLNGHEYTVRSRYLVGADGARSAIAEELGLPIEGVMGRAGTIYTLFKADLTRYVAHRPSILHWIMTPGAGFGEIGMGTFRVIRPWHQWIAGWGYDINGPEPDLRPEAVLPRIREMIGDPDVEVEIENVTTWQINQAWATQYWPGPGLLRRRRRAPAPALQRARLEHLHPGRVQPRLETRLRRQGLGRTRPAGVLLRRTRPGRRPGRRPRQPVPRRLRPGQRRLPHRRPGRPGRRGPGQAPRPRPRRRPGPRSPHRRHRVQEHRVQRPGHRTQPALPIQRRDPGPGRRRGDLETGPAACTCKPPPAPAPRSRTSGSSTRPAARSPLSTSPRTASSPSSPACPARPGRPPPASSTCRSCAPS